MSVSLISFSSAVGGSSFKVDRGEVMRFLPTVGGANGLRRFSGTLLLKVFIAQIFVRSSHRHKR